MPKNIQQLLLRLTQNNLSAAEQQELSNLLQDEQQKEDFLLAIQEMMQQAKTSDQFDEQRFIPLLNQILNADKKLPAPVKPLFKWKRFIAAASIILAAGIGSYFLLLKPEAEAPVISKSTTEDVKAPAATKAMITLADGTIVSLDSLTNGRLATQGDVAIFRSADGQIIYNSGENKNNALLLNTLTNPRGSKVIEMKLADGSQVWLNAGSSITYPVAFVDKKRTVSISGEAYFEVAKNNKMPFLVNVGNMTVEVLGTHFNINGYEEETSVKTTLLEGKVKIIQADKSLLLVPGQQAQVSNGSMVSGSADLDEVMAWKNGFFNFNNSDIKSIMLQLSQWYDVDVTYQGKISAETFSGIISRTDNISAVLKIMEEAGIKFRMEGRKIIVIS